MSDGVSKVDVAMLSVGWWFVGLALGHGDRSMILGGLYVLLFIGTAICFVEA
jgi:hypothetical protein